MRIIDVSMMCNEGNMNILRNWTNKFDVFGNILSPEYEKCLRYWDIDVRNQILIVLECIWMQLIWFKTV